MHRDTIAYMHKRGVDSWIVNFNQGKAFNSILHMYMMNMLSKIDLWEVIRNLIQLLDADICHAVQNNGWKINSFPIRSGVRQGFSLSPVLLVYCVEHFTESIWKNESVTG